MLSPLNLIRAAMLPAGMVLTGQAMPASAQSEPPAEVRCYAEAVNRQALDELVVCFAPDAVITDVSRPIRGIEAIRRWAAAEVMGGSVQILAAKTEADGRIRCLVHWTPEGSSGWRAWYTFIVEGGRIVAADLQYA